MLSKKPDDVFKTANGSTPPAYILLSAFNPISQGVSHQVNDAPDGSVWQERFLEKRFFRNKRNTYIIVVAGHNRQEIAHRWLITGKCAADQKQIEAVRIAGKDALFAKKVRKVILPFACINECPPNEYLFHAHDFTSCWNIITGNGFVENNGFSLENNISSLHILVGGSIRPVISVVLLLNPEKIHLWVSDVTKKNGSLIAGALQMEHLCVQLHNMNSHNLSQAYADIHEILALEKNTPNVYVCNTGGNRLMGIAALVAAADNRRRVIYRDLNSEYNSLTIIAKQAEWESGDILVVPRFKPAPGKTVNWQWLYDRSKEDLFRSPDELHSAFVQQA